MYLATYPSMSNLVDACDNAWQAGRRFSEIQRWISGGRARYHEEWMGIPEGTHRSWKGICDAFRAPWEEGLNTVQEMIYTIDREAHTLPTPTDRRRRRQYNPDDGDEVELERLRSGQDFWSQAKRTHVPGPQYVSIINNSSTAGGHNAADVLWRGAAAICVCDMLERRGYRCEIWTLDRCVSVFADDVSEETVVAVQLKQAGDPLDISQVTNGVSGWFYRTVLGFQALDIPTRPKMSYGSVRPLTEETPVVQDLMGRGAKPVTIDNVWNEVEALALVRRVIERLNSGEL